jgi:hypothetical protein
MYRYISMCIDTNVLKLLKTDFVQFVSIHISLVSIQKWFLRDRRLPVYRIMLACIDTHLCLSEIQRHHDVSNHACMIWYISVKISRNWCMYRYTPVFVSIHRSNLSFLNAGQRFCIDTNHQLYRYMSVKFCPNLLNSILSLNSNVLCHCNQEKSLRKFRKRFGVQIEWEFGSKVSFNTSSSSSSSLQSNWSLSMGSIQ